MPQADQQNKFGFCEDCLPTSDVGLVAYYLEPPAFFVIIIVSLVAGAKLSLKNLSLPILAMLTAGALIFQLAQSTIHLEKQVNVVFATKESGRSFESYGAESDYYRDKFKKVETRFSRIFRHGWLAYSVLPFAVGIVFGISHRRRVARRGRPIVSDPPTMP